MPTEQPSSAPADLPAEPREEASPAAVLSDEQRDDAPGGGGLGGAAAAGGLSGTAGPEAGTSRNSPVDLGVAVEGGGKEAREAAHLAAQDAGTAPHPASA